MKPKTIMTRKEENVLKVLETMYDSIGYGGHYKDYQYWKIRILNAMRPPRKGKRPI